MGQKLVRFTLVDKDGERIQDSGGSFVVCSAGSPDRLAVVTTSGGTLATSNNPITLTNGLAKFYVADTVSSFDLYGTAPGGQAIVEEGMVPSGPNELSIDTGQVVHLLKLPWSVADQLGDATETPFGVDIPDNAVTIGLGCGFLTSVVDAAITIDIGTDGGVSNDPNGFVAAASVANAVYLAGAGALLGAAGSTLAPVLSGATLTYTIATAADTASGFFLMPYFLHT